MEARAGNRHVEKESANAPELTSAALNTVYTPLDVHNREIRLLTLHYGEAHQDVTITLSVVSLNDKPKYEALSYVWGDSNNTSTISLDGYDFSVTQNLFKALRSLRQSHTTRIFWVDAICVNQKDILERNSQVSFMKDIYCGCALCIIWLGEEETTTETAMDIIKSMSRGQHLEHWFNLPALSFMVLRIYRERPTMAPLWNSIIDELEDKMASLTLFAVNSWWTRIWTVQEAILPAPGRSIIKCGRHEVGWDTVSRAVANSFHHIGGECCCSPIFISLTRRVADHYVNFISSVRNLIYAETALHGDGLKLLEALTTQRQRKASDPRDKVYGVLGLCDSQARQNIVVDYNCSIFDCYSSSMMHDIRTSGYLGALCFSDIDENNKKDFPSWLVDWSLWTPALEEQGMLYELYNLYHAAWDLEELPTLSHQTLSMRGAMRDTISVVGAINSLNGSAEESMPILRSWKALIDEYERRDSNQTAEPGNELKTFMRILMSDALSTEKGKGRRLQEADFDIWKRWWIPVSENNTLNAFFHGDNRVEAAATLKVSEHIIRYISDKRIFATQNGDVGIGPAALKVGDQIWILHGGKMPLILRPSPIRSGETQNLHKLVGPCYVDGIMDGEAADGLKHNTVHVHLE